MDQITDEELQTLPLVTDRQSLRDYLDCGYILTEASPYWRLCTPDNQLYALVDRALAEMIAAFPAH